MNFRFIYSTLGGISVLNALLVLICLTYSLLHEGTEEGLSTIWITCFCFNLIVALILFYWGRGLDKSRIFRREALAVVSIGWVYSGLFFALPFILYGIPIWDSLFESYSGLTTTGATIFADLDSVPRSFLLWRSLSQWLGGLGIVILFVALLGFIGVGSKALLSRENSAMANADLVPRVQSLTLRYLMIYVGFTAIGFIGLMSCGLSVFDAANHSFSAIATGGFSPHDQSVGYYDSPFVKLWMTAIMFAGGVAFPLHYLVIGLKRFNALKENEEFLIYGMILIFGILLIALDLTFIYDAEEKNYPALMVDAIFQAVSIMTTTGFGTTDYNQWPSMSKVVLILFMIIGGCAGSTACGLKVNRIVVFLKAAYRELLLTMRPNRVIRIRVNGKIADEGFVRDVIFYIGIYFVLLLTCFLGLSVLEPRLDLASIFTAALSCFNNVGPGLGEVGPASNFAFLNPVSKIWLCVFMLLGRLEIFAILLLIMPSFWKRF